MSTKPKKGDVSPPPVVDSVHPERVRALNTVPAPTPRPATAVTSAQTTAAQEGSTAGCVVYWMSRDQRAHDNWALLYARGLASLYSVPVVVAFTLFPRYLNASLRHFGFMLRGLEETALVLEKKNQIPFHFLRGFPESTIASFSIEHHAIAVVTDMSPLRIARGWYRALGAQLDEARIPFLQVDAHNVVPVWAASDKQEYAARTIRPKIQRLLGRFFVPFPELKPNNQTLARTLSSTPKFSAEDILAEMKAHQTHEGHDEGQGVGVPAFVDEVDWLAPGYSEGMKVVKVFETTKLRAYDAKRNNPTADALSNLSPYYHFVQLSPHAVALRLKDSEFARSASAGFASFFEESIVRRELADNFCFFNDNYDRIEGAASWAQATLALHASDPREYVYSRDDLELGKTHDPLWNACQLEMVTTGKMHGYLRMYWAKKILEWTSSPADALEYALYLNDKYELDGRDPNGYVGCMWAIAGIHDQGWAERPVFGKIRFMNFAGCRRKIKTIDIYIDSFPPARANALACGVDSLSAQGGNSDKKRRKQAVSRARGQGCGKVKASSKSSAPLPSKKSKKEGTR